MRNVDWGAVLAVLAIVWVFFPWLIGLTDAVAWMFTGAQWSSIPWGSSRGALAFLWPVGWIASGLLLFNT
jgi:hypothetical protein